MKRRNPEMNTLLPADEWTGRRVPCLRPGFGFRARGGFRPLLGTLVLCLGAFGVAAGEIELDIGSMAPKPQLGFGWGRSEMAAGRQYRWIKHLEADATVEIADPGDAVLEVCARPQYVPYTRQTVSVLVNGLFVGEWVCADHAGFETYRLPIPARFWRAGENQLTLRMAYRKKVGPDRRELSLCVDRIGITLE